MRFRAVRLGEPLGNISLPRTAAPARANTFSTAATWLRARLQAADLTPFGRSTSAGASVPLHAREVEEPNGAHPLVDAQDGAGPCWRSLALERERPEESFCERRGRRVSCQ